MMPPALSALLSMLRSLFWPRAALQAEVLALRHQLLVLKRRCAGRRVQFRTSDRVFGPCSRTFGQDGATHSFLSARRP